MNRRLKEAIRRVMPRSVRDHRILGGPLRGQLLITSWHDYPAAIMGTTERPLLEWFGKNVRPGQTWLDVGAHYGYTALALSRLVGSSGRVFAFEPMVGSAGCICRARPANRIPQLTVIPFALGACDDVCIQELPLERGMVDSTIGNREWRESFLVSRLDWLWPRIHRSDDTIDGIKIDVQGMEFAVLKGMIGVLRQHTPKLAIEFHSGVCRSDIVDLLISVGYCAVGQPIEPGAQETSSQYLDDKSYAFAVSQ